MLRKLGRGLFVIELMGQGVNYVTGDYSRGAAGFWVEGGKIAFPVHEITIAGNLRDMFQGIVAVGADAYTMGSKTTGSLLIERMKIAAPRAPGGARKCSARVSPGKLRCWRFLEFGASESTSFTAGEFSCNVVPLSAVPVSRACWPLVQPRPSCTPRRTFAGAWLPVSRKRWTRSSVPPRSSRRRWAKCPAASSRSRCMQPASWSRRSVWSTPCRTSTVELAHTAPYYFFGKDETFALGCAIPFGLNSRQMTAWMYEGNGLKLMREFYAQYNIVNFPGGNTGAQMGGWYRKEIKSMADIKGLKMRIGGFAGRVLERMGGVPQNIPGGEIYQALEKGTIDAAEWVGPYDDQKLGFNKVAPFYHYPGWWEGGPQLDFFINNKAYEGLPAEYKAMIEAAAALAHTDMQAKYDARNPEALKQLVGAKTKVLPIPKVVMDAAFNESMAVYSEISARNPNWKKIYADFANFRRDQNLWFRFTEAQFDRYMQSAKL